MSDETTILGPDGRPFRTAQGGTLLEPTQRRITHAQAVELVKSGRAYTPEAVLDLQKRASAAAEEELVEKAAHDTRRGARSQGVSMTSIWDRNRGKPKPTPITYETLRLMSNRAEWVRAIIKTRKNQIGKVPWSIVPKDDDDDSKGTEALVQRFTKLLRRPSMYGSRPSSRSWRQFIAAILEDVLVLDAGVIEKERTLGGSICALYPVDGSTIRPNIDDQGGHYDDAYVQVVDGVVCARFGMEEIVYIMDNEQTDVRFAGYGLSPLEHLVVTVTAELGSSKYNASYFEKGAVPEGLLNLGEDVPPEDVDAFRLYWMNEIMGRPWAIPILAGKNVEWVQWRDNNRDMQFMEYQAWLLKKACAVYQIAPQEIGMIEDVNRSTAEEQAGSNESKSIEPILSLLADAINIEIIGEHGEGLQDWIEFAWQDEGESAEEVNEKFSVAVEAGAATRAEWREALGLDTPDEDTPGAEGLGMFLSSGELKPLPSEEDAELLSVAKQQEREDEQAQREQEGGGQPSGMPWKPGQPDDPAIAAAQRQHDDENGIGVRNDGPGPQGPPQTAEEDEDVGKLLGRDRQALGKPCPTPGCGGKIKRAHPPDAGRKLHCPGCGRYHTADAVLSVGKTHPAGRDRAPALTAREDDLIGILQDAQRELVGELATILQLPEDLVDDAIEEALA